MRWAQATHAAMQLNASLQLLGMPAQLPVRKEVIGARLAVPAQQRQPAVHLIAEEATGQ
jgi:hypothetical protein